MFVPFELTRWSQEGLCEGAASNAANLFCLTGVALP
jgi:hypothetical protein